MSAGAERHNFWSGSTRITWKPLQESFCSGPIQGVRGRYPLASLLLLRMHTQ